LKDKSFTIRRSNVEVKRVVTNPTGVTLSCTMLATKFDPATVGTVFKDQLSNTTLQEGDGIVLAMTPDGKVTFTYTNDQVRYVAP
jgi:hypothetical protein